MNSAWVMCGGPSANRKLSVDGDIIAVNKDMFRYWDEAKYTITMDNRFTIWELTSKNRFPPSSATNIFVVNMADPNIKHEFSFSDKRWGMSYNLSYYDLIIKSYETSGFGRDFKGFRNGGNSGYCGVQLAICLGYTEIHLVGMDLCVSDGKTHHHDGYEKSHDNIGARLDEFYERFRRAIVNELSHMPQIRLINHSPISRLKDLIGYEPLG